jgi:hypothetical protein
MAGGTIMPCPARRVKERPHVLRLAKPHYAATASSAKLFPALLTVNLRYRPMAAGKRPCGLRISLNFRGLFVVIVKLIRMPG